jgi:protein TonB
MNPLLYAMNVGTFAVWLSVASFGTVGVVIPTARELLVASEVEMPYSDLESVLLTEDFGVGELPSSQETDTGDTGIAAEEIAPLAEQDTLPEPVEMPEVADLTPLPEIPDLPPPSPVASSVAAPAPVKERPVPRTAAKTPTRSLRPTNATGGSIHGSATSQGTAGNGGRNGGSGMSDAKRLAGGRMPAPSYPAEARAKGQTGTVIVEFVVGEDGRVVSAYAKSPSPWPLLNERAISCVRTWRFPAGKVTKYIRPIVFKLT